jgi:coenzyme F420 hydrogenase subunit beta
VNVPGISIERVVTEGLCVGCGACASVMDTPFEMTMTRFGMYEPRRKRPGGGSPGADARASAGADPTPAASSAERAAERACPFSGAGRDEDRISADAFPELPHHPLIGRWRRVRAAHATVDGLRANGSSGGMTSWFLSELFRRDLIDVAIHVRPEAPDEDGPLFVYDVSTSAAEAVSWQKTRYHAVEMSQAIAMIRSTPQRYAFVGLPCYVRALRSLAEDDERIGAGLVMTAALVCGHLKSARYGEYLAWTQGIPPGRLDAIDYRHKAKGRPADRYAIEAIGRDREGNTVRRERGVEHVRWSDWGIGLFKVPACDYCDDVVGETADVSFGDAWLPPYVLEPEGKNLVITRSTLAESIVGDGIRLGHVEASELTPDEAAASQVAGFRHRRQGLAVRLAERQRAGRYVPPKRVAPDPALLESPFGRRMLAREVVAQASHERYAKARRVGDLSVFYRSMRAPIRRYRGSSPRDLLTSVRETVEKRTPVAVIKLGSRVRSALSSDD